MTNLAGFDTCCSDTLISVGDAAESNLRVENSASGGRISVTPAFGPVRQSVGTVDLNGIVGNVIDGLSGSLVSAADAVDRGWTVVLSKEDSRLLGVRGDESIPLVYRDRTWWIDIGDVGSLAHGVDHRGSAALKEILYPHDVRHNGKALKVLKLLPSAESKVIYGGTTDITKRELETVRLVIHIHNVMGHASLDSMVRAISPGGCWEGVNLTEADLRRVFRDYQCLICVLAKTKMAGPMVREHPRDILPGEVISVDISPSSVPSVEGYTMVFVFCDQAVGNLHVFGAKSKTEFLKCLKEVHAYYRKYGYTMKKLCSDDEYVLKSAEVLRWLEENGNIEKLASNPYQHWQNLVERYIQTINVGTAALLHDQIFLGAAMWFLAMLHFVDCRNNTPNVHTGTSSPREMIEKKKVDLKTQFLFAFGQPVCVGVVEPDKIWKFDLRNELGIYVGQPAGHVGGNYIYMPYTGRTVIRGSCTAVRASNEQLRRIWGIREEMVQKRIRFSDLEKYYELVNKEEYDINQLELPLVPRSGEMSTSEGAVSGESEELEPTRQLILPSRIVRPVYQRRKLPRGEDKLFRKRGDLPEDTRVLRSRAKVGIGTASSEPGMRNNSTTGGLPGYHLLQVDHDYVDYDGAEEDGDGAVETSTSRKASRRSSSSEGVVDIESSNGRRVYFNDVAGSLIPSEGVKRSSASHVRSLKKRRVVKASHAVDQALLDVNQWSLEEELDAKRDAEMFLRKSLRDYDVPQMSDQFMGENAQGIVFEDEHPSIYRGLGYTQRGEKVEQWSDSDYFFYGGMANAARLVRGPNEPTVKQALEAGDRAGWIDAIRSEVLDQLLDPNQPSLVATDRSQVGLGGKPYKVFRTATRLVRKVEPKDPRIERKKKARICCDSSSLRGLFDDTYSPTVQSLTLSIMQHLSLMHGMEEILCDTVGAFLCQPYPCGPDDPEAYVMLDDRISDVCGLPRGQLYRIVRYLYGLPDAGKAYYEAYSKLLMDNGFKRSCYDPCLFFRFEPDGSACYAWCHVDDTYVIGTNIGNINNFLGIMERSQYEITVKELIDSYIGIRIEILSDGRKKMSQPKILNDLFVKYNVKEVPGAITPCRPPSTRDPDVTLVDPSEYLSLLGSLIFVLKTRLDIAFAVSHAATKSRAPVMEDMLDLLQILQYLYQTRDFGLIWKVGNPGDPLTLVCYVDASWLSTPDMKSQSGYMMSFGDSPPFYGKSCKQPTVMSSTSGAEQRALFQLTQEIVFVVGMCEEIRHPIVLPVKIYEDNQSTLLLSTRLTGQLKKSRHFLMLVYYVKEQVERGVISIEYIQSELNVADILTKGVFGRDFVYKRQRILGLQEGEEEVKEASRPLGGKSDEGKYESINEEWI